MKRLAVLLLVISFMLVSGFNSAVLTDDQMSNIIGKGGKGGGGGGSTYEPPVDPDGLTKWDFYDKFVTDSLYYWNGADYSSWMPDGYTDSDLDGAVDCNDSVIVVETLKNMGYTVPETSIDGLYYNYYSDFGYYEDVESESYYAKHDFDYTESGFADEQDLKDADWWLLDEGDLIFLDNDKDFIWDNAAIYLGWYGGYSNAALIASDYYDRALVVDLDDSNNIISLDVEYGYSDSRSLDYYNIEDYF